MASLLENVGTPSARRLGITLLEGALRRHPRSAVWDDTMWLKARIERASDQPEAAVATLQAILREREPSYLLGNYETAYYHRSQWELAGVLLDDLGRGEEGAAVLDELVASFAFSVFYDDALFRLASVRRELGDIELANEALERLVTERPESQLARRARGILDTGRDPGPLPAWSRPVAVEAAP
jgi:hypothetical protein